MDELNKLNSKELKKIFFTCCGSEEFAKSLAEAAPFKNEDDLTNKADKIWHALSQEECLKAFSHHPPIGEDLDSLRQKYKGTSTFTIGEQKGIAGASDETLEKLGKLNQDYLKKFTFVFLICATGKSADQILDILKVRIQNSIAQEIKNAKEEQALITKIRLKKILQG